MNLPVCAGITAALRQMIGGEVGQYMPTLLRHGDINNYIPVRDLLRSKYDGIFCLENTMRGDKYPAAIDDLAYFQDVVKPVKRTID